jgi:hypothetical protein
MNLINEALNQYRPAEGGTKDPLLGSNMKDALAGLSRGLKRRSLIVVISDFFCLNWEDELGRLCQKHDVIALRIVDPLARGLFSAGLIAMEDPETGVRIHAPTGFASFRSAWENWHRDRGSSWQARVRRAGAAPVDLYSDEDAATVLLRFFRSRRRKLK